jgi:putative ABC transport system ATP-binding protein
MWTTENKICKFGEPMTKNQTSDIIEAVDVHKTYQTGKLDIEALRGVSLKVQTGEIIAIMGTSGCGKTTLLNCLSSLDDISSGKVMIEGKDLAALSDNAKADLRSKKMGFIFQSYNLLPVLSAVENVELPLMVGGFKRSEARKKAIESLELVGLDGREHHRPAELSGGQQQRVAIARSLINDPLIIWADEPTGNLDQENSGSIMELLSQLNKEHRQTYILVTHDPKVAKFADRTLKMESGRIVA